MHLLLSVLLRTRWFGFFLICCAAWPSRAQSTRRVVEEPRWLKFNIREASTGVYAEGIYDETSFDNSDTKVSHDRFFVGPLLGISAGGSIYHPNLLRYDIQTEGAVGWSQSSVRTSTKTTTTEEFQYLGRFNGVGHILANKPYNGEIFGGYDHSYRDYDFFNRVIVDSWIYGARAAYSTENLFLNSSYTHRDEDVSGLNVNTASQDDTVTFSARHDRKTAGTTFNYSYNQYDRTDFGRTGVGTDHTVTLSDYEQFGSRQQHALNSTASYNHRDSVVEISDQLTAGSSLSLEHRHNLSSIYDVNYDHFESGGYTSDGISGNAELRHQLYESLSSSLIFRGADSEFSDERSSGFTRRFGGGISEAYTKRIGDTARVRVSNSLIVDHVDQQYVSTMKNERHSFDEGSGPPGTFFLNLTRVVESTIVVTDQNDSQPPFVRGFDYEVQVNGERTLITYLSGSRIPVGATVLIDYEAEPSPAGSYETLTETFQVRIELWKNLWGIYGRFNMWRNNADKDLRVPNLTSYAVGTDYSWRWFRTGMEYEVYDSDLSEYRAARLYQSMAFNLDAGSTLSFDFTESWVDYVDAGRQEEDFRFIARYRQPVTPRLRFDIEGGVDVRRGDTVDQTLATVRPVIEYGIGKTSIKAGYDFEYNLFDNEERMRHLLFFRLKRVF